MIKFKEISKSWRDGTREEQIIYQAVKDKERGNGADLQFIRDALNKKEQKLYMEYYNSNVKIVD